MTELKRNGYTLVEVMISLGIIGTVTLAVSTFLVNAYRYEKRILETGAREELVAEVQKIVTDMRHVSRSADLAGNIQLRRCLDRSSAEDCIITSVDDQVDISIAKYSTTGDFQRTVSGTTTNPVIYGDMGQPDCTISAKCPSWKVRTSFWAKCAGNNTACAQAATIHIRYQVYPATERDWGTPVPIAVPPEPAYSTNKDSYSTPLQVRTDFEISQQCPAGSQQFGFDRFGRIQCECLPNTVQTGTVNDAGNILPVCRITADRCLPGQVIIGKTLTGGIRCGVPRYRAVSPNVMMNFQRCVPNSWIRTTRQGGCSVSRGATRKDPVIINCGANLGTCYREDRP